MKEMCHLEYMLLQGRTTSGCGKNRFIASWIPGWKSVISERPVTLALMVRTAIAYYDNKKFGKSVIVD